VVIGTLTELRDSDDIAAEMAEERGEAFEFEFAFIEWVWSVEAPEDFAGYTNDDGTVPVSGRTSKSSGARSKAFKWISALKGNAAVQPGARFTPDVLIGSKAQLTIEVNDRGYNQVAEVTAMPKSR
jgi:hypothetical protein